MNILVPVALTLIALWTLFLCVVVVIALRNHRAIPVHVFIAWPGPVFMVVFFLLVFDPHQRYQNFAALALIVAGICSIITSWPGLMVLFKSVDGKTNAEDRTDKTD